MADAYRPPTEKPACPFKPLTRLESEIAQGIGRGLSYKQIAGELRLTTGTVKQYVSRMAAKWEDNGLPPRFRIFVWIKWHEWQEGR